MARYPLTATLQVRSLLTETQMSFTVTPLSGPAPGFDYAVYGYLRTTGGVYLNGEEVHLIVDGIIVNTTTTHNDPGDLAGYFDFPYEHIAGLGSHSVYCAFHDTAVYSGSQTPTSTLVVTKIATNITATFSPAPSGGYVTVPASTGDIIAYGYLRDASGNGINGVTVDMVAGGVVRATDTTHNDPGGLPGYIGSIIGWGWYNIPAGTYSDFHLVFAGNDTYLGCEKNGFTVYADGVPSPIPWEYIAAGVGGVALVSGIVYFSRGKKRSGRRR